VIETRFDYRQTIATLDWNLLCGRRVLSMDGGKEDDKHDPECQYRLFHQVRRTQELA